MATDGSGNNSTDDLLEIEDRRIEAEIKRLQVLEKEFRIRNMNKKGRRAKPADRATRETLHVTRQARDLVVKALIVHENQIDIDAPEAVQVWDEQVERLARQIGAIARKDRAGRDVQFDSLFKRIDTFARTYKEARNERWAVQPSITQGVQPNNSK